MVAKDITGLGGCMVISVSRPSLAGVSNTVGLYKDSVGEKHYHHAVTVTLCFIPVQLSPENSPR